MQPSIFRQKTEEIAKGSLISTPPGTTGWVISTSDVVKKDIENPYFQSLSGMTAVSVNKLLAQSKDWGLSVITNVPGATKETRVHINPKMTDNNLSCDSGKLSNLTIEPNSMVLADMLHVGSEFATPTVIGLNRKNAVPMNVNATPSDRDYNTDKGNATITPAPPSARKSSTTPAPGASSANGSLTPMPKTSPLDPFKNKTVSPADGHSSIPRDISPDTGKESDVPANFGTNYQGKNSLTGTLLKTPSEILLGILPYNIGF